ncbi:heterokaryon incompatibility protein-domain-containing protein [Lasiosphaeria ovina]|uniref:Heterokaryon incompatibility protein-domain-containing protein n=1 Tax=Lasiosphaeria ovina TaxID=92902 RepID=A0AAE0NMB4_9PEZI|nr:heterokaryon incompatibility protein-domain-containing protein [Lasiosphaeria ovina]
MELNAEDQELCAICRDINMEDLKSDAGYVHQPSVGAMISSTDSCDLCRLIAEIFKRSIHEQRRATHPVRSISDVKEWGPVRLFAASRELDSASNKGYQRRERCAVKDELLSYRVAVTCGELEVLEKLHYGPETPTLIMYTEQGSFAELMGVVGFSSSARGIQDDPLCDFNIKRITKWIEHCEIHHSNCNGTTFLPNLGPYRGPKMLIDVGLHQKAKVQLIRTEGRVLRYAALSYCWGANQGGMIATNDTVKQMTKGVSSTLFSQTIQDAVTVVGKLGMRYLWVDALCIIQGQDQTAKWMDEIERMGHIYLNAHLTIAASSANAASQGFLSQKHRSGIPVAFKVRKDSRCEGTIFFREWTRIVSSFDDEVRHGPLLRRAWVLQERILSRRILDFTSKQVYWSCAVSRQAENGQMDCEGAVEENTVIQCLRTFPISFQAGEQQRKIVQAMFFKSWAELISQYSGLQLTYETDRLPALAGIADVASRIVPGRYLSGIWEADLSSGLLWKPRTLSYPARRTGVSSVPTWSWASVVGPVEAFASFGIPGPFSLPPTIRLLSTGAHESGRTVLHLQGRVHRCFVDLNQQPPSSPCRSDRKLRDPRIDDPRYGFRLEAAFGPRPPGAEFENYCIFDGARGAETIFYALGIECDKFPRGLYNRGLLLRMLEKRDTEIFYERIGTIRSMDCFWYALGEKKVSLI